MSVLDIRQWPDPVLSAVCRPVDRDVRGLAQDMLDTMYAAPGRGLAAPQVGETLRMFVMDAGWKEGRATPMVCIDPVILDRADTRVEGPEACLSIQGVEAQVSRAPWIVLRWRDAEGTAQEARLDGAAAVIAQHEYDHLDGRVIFDRLEPEARARAEAAHAG